MAGSLGAPMPDLGVSNTVLGLANAGIVLVLYGALGLAGLWLLRKVGLPTVFRQNGAWRGWVFIPMFLGVLCGVALILFDNLLAPINGFGHFVHPVFPISILASLSAGIGEEIMFRGFVFGLWAFIFNWLLKRFNGHVAALWIANLIAALAFGAGHMGSLVFLTGASSLADLSPVLIAETFFLNGMIGLVAGERLMKDGLVAAMGVHFWTDMVWHVFWGLLGA